MKFSTIFAIVALSQCAFAHAPSRKPIVSPHDSGVLIAIGNIDQRTVTNPDYLASVAPTNIITDCNTNMMLAGAVFNDTFAATLKTLKATCPKTIIGSYLCSHTLDDRLLSSNGAPSDGWHRGDPITNLPMSTFPTRNELLWWSSSNRLVPATPDYRQPDVLNRLVAAQVRELVWRQQTYGVQFVLSDNWDVSDPNANKQPYPITLPDVLNYLRALADALHSNGIKICPNMGYWVHNSNHTPSPCTDQQLTRAANKADAIMFEHPLTFNQQFGWELGLAPLTPTAGDVAAMVYRYQLFGRAGCPVIMAPSTTDGGGANDNAHLVAEQRFCAGFAMIVQQPDGSGPLVGWETFLPRFDWVTWPKQFGLPVRPIEQSGITLSRKFQNGTITIDFSTRTVTTK